MKTIIAGCRDYDDTAEVIKAIINSGFIVTEVVSGGAEGVDRTGEALAQVHGYPVKHFLADWKMHRKAAGPIRNRQMAEYAEALIAVWDGKSPGTKNMIEEAKKRELKIYVHLIPQDHK